MIQSSECQHWQTEKAANAVQEQRSYTTPWGTIPDRVDQAPSAPAVNAIEIELPGGYRVRIGCGVKAAALRLVLDALERR